KSYFKINSPVFVTQSVVYVTIFAKTGRRKVLFSAWKKKLRINAPSAINIYLHKNRGKQF
ncbi:hypothetical protein, partial [Escherichia coli]